MKFQLNLKKMGNLERCGFIVNDKLIEVQNVAQDPKNSFEISDDDQIKYIDIASASWHTHPNCSSQLSTADYFGFQAWSHIRHFILGIDGVSCYSVQENGLIVEIDMS